MIYSTIEGTATIDSVYLGKDAKINGCGQSIGTLAGRVMASGELTIKNCVIEGNHIDDWQKNRFRGGFVSTSYGKLTIEDCAFYGEMTKFTGGIKDNAQHAGIIQVVGKDAKCTDAGYTPTLTLKNVVICAKIPNAYDEKGQNLKQVVYLMQEPGEGVTVNAENVFYVQSTAAIKGFAPEGAKIDRTAIMGSKAESFIADKGLSKWFTTEKFMMPKAVVKMLYPEIEIPEDNADVETKPVATTPAETTPAETTPETANVEADGGCGGAISFAGIAIVVTFGACATIVSKKRR
jgi:hypothetical protein